MFRLHFHRLIRQLGHDTGGPSKYLLSILSGRVGVATTLTRLRWLLNQLGRGRALVALDP
jgi:hypothetical protein